MHISEAFLSTAFPILSHSMSRGKEDLFIDRRMGTILVQISHCLLILILSYLLGILTVLDILLGKGEKR